MNARDIVEKYLTENDSSNWCPGKIVKHPAGYLVVIIGGQFWGKYGLSNFWSWQRFKKDGTTSKKVHNGYGWDETTDVNSDWWKNVGKCRCCKK